MQTKHPLTDYREGRGLSQDDLAKLIGVTRWTVNRIECGKRKPSIELVGKIVGLSGGQLSANDFLPQNEPA